MSSKNISTVVNLQRNFVRNTQSLPASSIPPSFFESAGILKHDDSTDWNDPNVLKQKLDYYEKILLEKDEQLKTALEEVELLKQKNNQKSNKQQK